MSLMQLRMSALRFHECTFDDKKHYAVQVFYSAGCVGAAYIVGGVAVVAVLHLAGSVASEQVTL